MPPSPRITVPWSARRIAIQVEGALLSSAGGRAMKAREVMTTKVVSVGPDLATRKVAKMLIDNKISAVPVVDDKGSPIGMVSEGDLVSCDTDVAKRCQRQQRDHHRELVCVDHPDRIRRARIEVLGDPRQRDVDERGVKAR